MQAYCNLTQLVSPSVPSYLCADTGSTHTLLRESDAPYITRTTPAVNNLHVLLPNGQAIHAIGTCHLHLPHIHCPFVAHIFPDTALNTSLLSIGQLCQLGCTATFTSDTVHIVHDNRTVLHGSKLPTDRLWSISAPLSTPIANAAHALTSDAEFVTFAHAALGSPAISTLTQAVRRGYLHSYSGLTTAILTAHRPNSMATAKGHLDQQRQGQRSTQIPLVMFDTDDNADDANTASPTISSSYTNTSAYTQVILASHTLNSDLTGRFPVTSRTGAQYMFVSVLDGYIHVEPMKTRHHNEYVSAYKRTLNFFARCGRRPSFQRLDNETSGPLEAFAADNNITIQYCPPHTHRSLKAERAIRTFKNHFIATLCTAAPDFPLTLWDDMLPQIEICLNHLLPYAPNNAVSAYAGIHGGAFDFAKHPIAPIGTRVLIHDKPTVRTSWAPHGVPGFYLGPALQHYRSYRVWSTTTNNVRVTDTVAWFPHAFTMHGPTSHDMLIRTIDNLQSALLKFSTTLPALRHAAQPTSLLINSIAANLHDIANMHLPTTLPLVPPPDSEPAPPSDSGPAAEQRVVDTLPVLLSSPAPNANTDVVNNEVVATSGPNQLLRDTPLRPSVPLPPALITAPT